MIVRRTFSWIMIAIVAIVGAVHIVPMFIPPWTPINCTYMDVDIRTGRTRITRYLAYRKISERIDESALSRVLPREMVDGVKPEWERVNTFSPGVNHSPYHWFHGAFNQIHNLEDLWQTANVDEPARRKMALNVLALWQFGGSHDMADDYIQGLDGLFDAKKREPLLQTIRALEIPEEHAEGDHLVLTVSYPDGRPMVREEGYRDAKGQFVNHGTREAWHAGGKRKSYEYFDHGRQHGLGFRWGGDGELNGIEKYKNGETVYRVSDTQNLKALRKSEEVRRNLEIGPGDRTDRRKVGGKVITVGLLDASQPGVISLVRPEAAQIVGPIVGPREPTPLTVHGLVIDATTKRAIPRFRLVPGALMSPGVTWQPHLITTHRGGRFDLPPDVRAWDKTRFRVEAEGYRPVVSRVVEKSEGDVKLTFAMQADAGISAVVRTPDGTPAAGAHVAWATLGREATGRGATIAFAADERFGYRVVTADAEGRFRLPAECDPGMIIVAHGRGYAEVRPADVIASGVVALRRWCRVEGRLLAGTKPVVGRKIRVYRIGSASYEAPTPSWEDEAITDADGRFACDRVVAGRLMIDRVFSAGDREGVVQGLVIPIEAREGQITRVGLGGPGRTLVGRFEAPKGFDLPIDWTKSSVRLGLEVPPVVLNGDEPDWAFFRKFVQSEESRAYFRDNLPVGPDGSFRIESVPPGNYQLIIWIEGPAVGKPAETRVFYAIGGVQFLVDPTVNIHGTEPQSLGTITVRPQPRASDDREDRIDVRGG
jgi:hypothetical protein